MMEDDNDNKESVWGCGMVSTGFWCSILVDTRAHRLSKLQTIELKLRKISCATDTGPVR